MYEKLDFTAMLEEKKNITGAVWSEICSRQHDWSKNKTISRLSRLFTPSILPLICHIRQMHVPNITSSFYFQPFPRLWSLKEGHSLFTSLFTIGHPRWHLCVRNTAATAARSLNWASGDKQSPVLATGAVQRSAGRKGSAAGWCECYHRRAETSG